MRALTAVLAVLAAVCVCPASADLQQGRTITVDDDGAADFATIQAAIDDANDGDTIIVADGTYTGVGNRGIDFWGKAITVRSETGADNCIIDCQMADRGFIFQSDEDANSVLDGFTISWGSAVDGGGISCNGASPTIMSCIIKDNRAERYGGGIDCYYSSPTIEDCVVTGNRGLLPYATGGGINCEGGSPTISGTTLSRNFVDNVGGGIACHNSSAIIYNCILSNNSSGFATGGIHLEQSSPMILNCTIVVDDVTVADRGGIGAYEDSAPVIKNCILWGNGDDLYNCSATYSCIEDDEAGKGNIHADPYFNDPKSGDLHLISQAGRWDPNTGTWVIERVTSPCIDAGNPMTVIGLEPFPNGGIVNMGAYGGTHEASKSYFGEAPCETIVAGDVNGDCEVNFLDFRLMALHWMEEN